MGLCAVFGCCNSGKKNCKLPPSQRVSLHTLPSKEPYRSRWIQFCGRKDPLNEKYARICSKHFTPEDIVDNLKHRLLGYSPPVRERKLKPDAVPSLYGPKTSKLSEKQMKSNCERSKRLQKRVNRQIVKSLLADADGTPWRPTSLSVVCGDHYVNGMTSTIETHPGYVPSILSEIYKKKAGSENRVLEGQPCIQRATKRPHEMGDSVPPPTQDFPGKSAKLSDDANPDGATSLQQLDEKVDVNLYLRAMARRSRQSAQPSSIIVERQNVPMEQLSPDNKLETPVSSESQVALYMEEDCSKNVLSAMQGSMDHPANDDTADADSVEIKIEDVDGYEYEDQEIEDDTSTHSGNNFDQRVHEDSTEKEGRTRTENFLLESIAEERGKLFEENRKLRDEIATLKAAMEEQQKKFQLLTNDYVCLKSELVEKQIISDETMSLRAEIQKLQSEVEEMKKKFQAVTNDNVSLRGDLETAKNFVWSEKGFEGDDDKTKFYTGVPTFRLLRALCELVENEIPPPRHFNNLRKFQEFLMVFMRLRLGLLSEDLGYRFGVARCTVSRALGKKWVRPMANMLSSSIAWPNREEACKTYPQCVRHVFGDRFVVIVDVLELSIRMSETLSTTDKSGSTTAKHLIAYTPQGAVCYVSDMWTGSDDRAQFSELLYQLKPEDIVIAGKHFDFAEELGLHRTPSGFQVYTKSESHLRFPKNIKTKEISFLMQRVTSLIKLRYRLLQSDLSRSFLVPPTGGENGKSLLSYVVTLCCGLINTCQSVESNNSETAIQRLFNMSKPVEPNKSETATQRLINVSKPVEPNNSETATQRLINVSKPVEPNNLETATQRLINVCKPVEPNNFETATQRLINVCKPVKPNNSETAWQRLFNVCKPVEPNNLETASQRLINVSKPIEPNNLETASQRLINVSKPVEPNNS